MLIQYPGKRKSLSKKDQQIFGVDKQQQQQQESFTIISTDESFFFHDSLVRRVWIYEKKRPIVRVTAGSHKHSCIFGAISMEGNHQIFRQYMIDSMVIHFLII
jgi:hypothetical protein